MVVVVCLFNCARFKRYKHIGSLMYIKINRNPSGGVVVGGIGIGCLFRWKMVISARGLHCVYHWVVCVMALVMVLVPHST